MPFGPEVQRAAARRCFKRQQRTTATPRRSSHLGALDEPATPAQSGPPISPLSVNPFSLITMYPCFIVSSVRSKEQQQTRPSATATATTTTTTKPDQEQQPQQEQQQRSQQQRQQIRFISAVGRCHNALPTSPITREAPQTDSSEESVFCCPKNSPATPRRTPEQRTTSRLLVATAA